MEKLDFVFQTDSDIVCQTYENDANFIIEYSGEISSTEKYCVIYFSSHDIYFPNNEASFRSNIINKNKFEWYNNRIKRGEKHIFLRDIKKQWYLTGINGQINSIEKIYDFLLKETNGYKIITIGSSAGGYAAVLLGSMLKAKTIFSFNGQFYISDLLERTTPLINPTIFRERGNPDINKFYSLKPYLSSPGQTYYFYSMHSNWDSDQQKHVCDSKLKYIPFRTKHHGIPFLKSNLPLIINLSNNDLDVLTKKTHHPLLFSLEIDGIGNTLKNIIVILYKYLLKKIKERSKH